VSEIYVRASYFYRIEPNRIYRP